MSFWCLKIGQMKKSPIKYFLINLKKLSVFLFNLFSEARAEILEKICWFLVKTMTPKGHFEIN
jgi:hypothetical protein